MFIENECSGARNKGPCPFEPELPGACQRDRIRVDPESADLTVYTSAVTGRGLVRESNEDAVRVIYPSTYGEMMNSGVFAMIADGMGGANAGECASNMATAVIPQIFAEDSSHPPMALAHALEAANRSIYGKSQADERLSGMGTTCVVLILTPKQAWIAWVGDSRVYLIRNHMLIQITEDHSLVAEMVRGGLLTTEQANRHQDRHVLTKALGTQPTVEPSISQQAMPVEVGDRFLLCSDGLHDLLTENQLLTLSENSSVQQAAADLIQKANELGGTDNISAILLEIGMRQTDVKFIEESSAEFRSFSTLPDRS